MSRVFVELYLDEDVDILVAKRLLTYGFTVVTTREAGCLGNSDADQLAYAAARGMALLTHNRADFEEIANAYIETGRPHCGIILAVRRAPHEIVRRLLGLLDQVTSDEMRNLLRYI